MLEAWPLLQEPWRMKRLLNALSLGWKTYQAGSLLLTAWNFMRDHFDGI